MEYLNAYLHQLVSRSGSSLHLEPNKNPYVVAEGGRSEIGLDPLQGSQINTLIFTLIPSEVKQQLPGSSEVEFVHPHNLGNFTFTVRKSPAGFNVMITPEMPEPEYEPEPEPAMPAVDPLEGLEFNSVAPTSSNDIHGITYSAEEESKTEVELEGFELESGYDIPDEPAEEEAEEPVFLSSQSSYTPEIEIIPDPPARTETVEPETPEFEAPAVPAPEPVFEAAKEPETETVLQPEPAMNETPQAPVFEPEPEPEPAPVAFEAPQPSAPAAFEPPQPVREVRAEANPRARAKMDELFRQMAAMGSSDLHLSVSVPPMVRKDGKMAQLDPSAQALTPDSIRELLTSIMPEKNLEEFERRNDTDFAYEIPDLARFRANIFKDRKGMGGVFRIIPSDMLTAEDLGLSKHILDLCDLSKGLVVVTGPTGSGKSTTLCAMINHINERREDHIITIEDPIEFTHENKKCLVNQREVHNHTDSFKDALRAALREDPDILLVGEMRDLETISIAIETAETGHLVFGTLHTTTAASTVDRIIDQFPADRQQQIRVMLSESLRGVIAQTLLPKKGGGRVAALEVLIVTPAISNLIREGKTFQIPSAMQTGKNLGMMMLNDSLMDLVKQGVVEPRDAYIKAVDKTGFELLLQRSGMSM